MTAVYFHLEKWCAYKGLIGTVLWFFAQTCIYITGLGWRFRVQVRCGVGQAAVPANIDMELGHWRARLVDMSTRERERGHAYEAG